jgi:polyphosphate kinase
MEEVAQQVDADLLAKQIFESNYISRDLSWMQFNYRVLDQAKHIDRSIFDRLKFLSITASNLDEFCTIRLGSLYNYLDYSKERYDYSGLREEPFRNYLMNEIHKFVAEQCDYFVSKLKPLFEQNNFRIADYPTLNAEDKARVDLYFQRTIYPMLTPMLFDNYHTFPVLKNNRLLFGVVTKAAQDHQNQLRVSFIQVPSNIPRFFEILNKDNSISFVSVEDIIRNNIHHLFRNIEIVSVNLFRINRNGDFTLEESEDIESNFLEELKRKLQTRRSGRVVRLDVLENPDPWMMRMLKIQWDLDDHNIFIIPKDAMVDFTGIQQIVNHTEFKSKRFQPQPQVKPISYP